MNVLHFLWVAVVESHNAFLPMLLVTFGRKTVSMTPQRHRGEQEARKAL